MTSSAEARRFGSSCSTVGATPGDNPDVAELVAQNKLGAEACHATDGGVTCEVKVGQHHMHGRMHKGGGHVWVTPPKCERCGDSGNAIAEMGCFGVRRWKRCDCDAGTGSRRRLAAICERMQQEATPVEAKPEPTPPTVVEEFKNRGPRGEGG